MPLLLLQIFQHRNCFQELSVLFGCIHCVLINVFILCVTFFSLESYNNYMWVCFHFTDFVSQPSEAIPERTTLHVQNGYVEF